MKGRCLPACRQAIQYWQLTVPAINYIKGAQSKPSNRPLPPLLLVLATGGCGMRVGAATGEPLPLLLPCLRLPSCTCRARAATACRCCSSCRRAASRACCSAAASTAGAAELPCAAAAPVPPSPTPACCFCSWPAGAAPTCTRTVASAAAAPCAALLAAAACELPLAADVGSPVVRCSSSSLSCSSFCGTARNAGAAVWVTQHHMCNSQTVHCRAGPT